MHLAMMERVCLYLRSYIEVVIQLRITNNKYNKYNFFLDFFIIGEVVCFAFYFPHTYQYYSQEGHALGISGFVRCVTSPLFFCPPGLVSPTSHLHF